jgi:hypothetical protein
MSRKRHTPEQIIRKLREAEVEPPRGLYCNTVLLAVPNGREHYFTRAIADRESKCPLPLKHFPPRWWFSEALGLWARQCWRRPCYRRRTSKFS